MAWCHFGTKPLPEPMIALCHLDPHEQTSVKFVSIYKNNKNVACKMSAILSRPQWVKKKWGMPRGCERWLCHPHSFHTMARLSYSVSAYTTYPSLRPGKRAVVLPLVCALNTLRCVSRVVPSGSSVRVMVTVVPVAVGSLYSVNSGTPFSLFSHLCALAADLMSIKATVAEGFSSSLPESNLTLWILPYLKKRRHFVVIQHPTNHWNFRLIFKATEKLLLD